MKNARFVCMVVSVCGLLGAIVMLARAFTTQESLAETQIANSPLVDTTDDGVTEIGWRPVISTVQQVKLTDVAYVLVKIDGETRECFMDVTSHGALVNTLNVWRVNEETRMREVYVLAKKIGNPARTVYFAMRDARILRALRQSH